MLAKQDIQVLVSQNNIIFATHIIIYENSVSKKYNSIYISSLKWKRHC